MCSNASSVTRLHGQILNVNIINFDFCFFDYTRVLCKERTTNERVEGSAQIEVKGWNRVTYLDIFTMHISSANTDMTGI